MNEYSILLNVIKDVEKIEGLNDFGKIDNIYSVNLKSDVCYIIKDFLKIIENYDKKPYSIRRKYKVIGNCFLFNWMLTHHVKLNIFIKNFPNFEKVVDKKLEEFRLEIALDNCKYWKGVDVYKKYLLK